MKHSESFAKVAMALSKARKSFSKAKQSKTNTHLKNSYATLTDVLDAVQPSLDDNGIVVLQEVLDSDGDKWMQLQTILMHESGEWLSFNYKMPVEKLANQAYGSTTSYARRYALAAVLAVGQTDDDAELAKRSPEDFKKLVSGVKDLDALRAVYSNAKNSLSSAEWKVVEGYLLDKKSELEAEAAPVRGFNPSTPNAVSKSEVDDNKPIKQNAPQDIEDFIE